MHKDLPQRVELICPACRAVTEAGLSLWTVSLAEVFFSDDSGEVLEGLLLCENPACRQKYPIVDGIPILVADPAGLLSAQPAALTLPLSAKTQALLAQGGSDDAPLHRLLEHLSIYLDAHFGDRATPRPDGPARTLSAGHGGAAIFAALGGRAVQPVNCAVELGCSVGRGLLSLVAGAQLSVGVDLHLYALRIARRILSGEAVAYARRVVGRHYEPVQLAPLPAAPASRIALICGDALDPPLCPRSFGRVAAMNLLDSVRSPPQLLSVVDGLLAPGGELLLASPYSWQSGVVDEAGRIGGADPATALRQILQSGDGLQAAYAIEAEDELPWQLRRDARTVHLYAVHMLRARKLEARTDPPAY